MDSHCYRTETAGGMPSTRPINLRAVGSVTALIIDRLADIELQHGHHERADQLSRLAAEMRGAP